jgi:signal transduction histidine kinase
MSDRLRHALHVAGLAAVYVTTARLGLELDAVEGFATLVWAPTGIALAALLVLGPSVWPGVAIGAAIANLWTGAPPLVSLGIAAGNTLEALIGAHLLRLYGDFQPALQRVRDVVVLVLGAALISTLVSASLGVLSLVLGGVIPSSHFLTTWRAWWIGDATGDLIVAPALLAWSARGDREAWPTRRLEALALLLSVLVVSCFVFAWPWPVSPGWSAVRRPHFLLPPIIWATLRFGPKGAASATLIGSVVAIYGTVRELGPFVHSTLHESLNALQAYMGMMAVTFLVVGAAVSERKRAALDNQRLYREARAALALRDEILSVVSHDLQNPLGVILLKEGALLKEHAVNGKALDVHKHSDAVRRAVERMQRLIEDLVDFAAIQSGQFSVHPEPHDAATLVREVAETFAPAAEVAKINLRTDTGERASYVSCDRVRLLQALTNLVSNAIQVTRPGGSITLRVAESGSSVTFSVADTGPGIGPEDLPRVFERYFRGDGVAYKGTGLGLAIVKGVADAHGGRVWVESTPSAGSTFFIMLNRAPKPQDMQGATDDGPSWTARRNTGAEPI